MAFVSVYFGLGTNQGNRSENIKMALEALDKALGCHFSALSSIIEAPSWGFEGEDFLNAVVRYRVSRPKDEPTEAFGLRLLDAVKRIEREMGRRESIEHDADGRRIYHDRVIDIDILFIANDSVHHERLQVPHPLIAQRDFVLLPLKEVATPSLMAHFPQIIESK